MLFFDIAAVMAVLGLGIIGGGFIHAYWKRLKERDPRTKARRDQLTGSVNVKRMHVEHEQRCSICGIKTAPETDLFVDYEWFHRDCYESVST